MVPLAVVCLKVDEMWYFCEAALIPKTSSVSFNSVSTEFKQGLWPFRKLAHLDLEAL